MPYSINNPTLMEIQVIGKLHGQTTRNVFHYAKTDQVPVADGKLEVGGTLSRLEAQVYEPIRLACSDEWVCQFLQGQIIKPVRYRLVQHVPLVGAGAIAGQSLPSGCAVCISVMSETADRASRGRKFFAGIPSVHEADSNISAQAQTLWSDVKAKLLSSSQTGQCVWHPWLGLSPSSLDPVYNERHLITDATVRTNLRYQRRREVGKGE